MHPWYSGDFPSGQQKAWNRHAASLRLQLGRSKPIAHINLKHLDRLAPREGQPFKWDNTFGFLLVFFLSCPHDRTPNICGQILNSVFQCPCFSPPLRMVTKVQKIEDMLPIRYQMRQLIKVDLSEDAQVANSIKNTTTEVNGERFPTPFPRILRGWGRVQTCAFFSLHGAHQCPLAEYIYSKSSQNILGRTCDFKRRSSRNSFY